MSGDKTQPLDPCPICAQAPELIRFNDPQITPNVKCNNPACLLEGREFDYRMWQGAALRSPRPSLEAAAPSLVSPPPDLRARLMDAIAEYYNIGGNEIQAAADKILALLGYPEGETAGRGGMGKEGEG